MIFRSSKSADCASMLRQAHEWGGVFADVVAASHFGRLRPGLRVAINTHGGHYWSTQARSPSHPPAPSICNLKRWHRTALRSGTSDSHTMASVDGFLLRTPSSVQSLSCLANSVPKTPCTRTSTLHAAAHLSCRRGSQDADAVFSCAAGAAAAADGHNEPPNRCGGARDAGAGGHLHLAHALHRLVAAPTRLDAPREPVRDLQAPPHEPACVCWACTLFPP